MQERFCRQDKRTEGYGLLNTIKHGIKSLRRYIRGGGVKAKKGISEKR